MFRSARWRSDKSKFKAVFKLQFHATQVPQLVGDALMITVIALDVGKPTVKSEKATVRNGSCYWESPVYETVKFVREAKTGKVYKKIYNFVLSNGSSKTALLGEVSIDFADYAEATNLSCVSLPLKIAKSESVLHVSIQKIQENVGQRDFVENEDAKVNSQGRSLKAHLSSSDTEGNIQANSIEDGLFSRTSSHIAELDGNGQASSGSDVTISGSESSSGVDTPRDLGLKNKVHQHSTSFQPLLSHVSAPQKPPSDLSSTLYEEHQRSQWEWLGGSAPEASTDDSSSSPRDVLVADCSHEESNAMVDRLKTELAVLARQVEMSELELQTMRKQIVKESKRGQDLLREIASLKEERDALKKEHEKHKVFLKCTEEAKVRNKVQFQGGDLQVLLEELRQELNHEKELNASLSLQLKKTQESNSELIFAVHDLEEMLEQKNRESSKLSNISATTEIAKELRERDSKSESDDDEEQKALEEIVKEHGAAKEAHILEQKIMDLCSELEIYRRDKDEVEMQMEQLALDYEILKQENHDLSYKLEQSQLQEQLKMQYECSSSYATISELETQIENLEIELKKLSEEFSDSLAAINELETHVKSLEEELEKQAQGFEADLDALMHAKIEQEQRAIQAEEALRKIQGENIRTAERLQGELRKLSVQMMSTFAENEKLATKASTEAGELRLQKSHLEEMLQKAKEEIESVRDHYEAKVNESAGQLSSKTNQMEQMQSQIEVISGQLAELQKKMEEETSGVLSQEILMLRSQIGRLTTENNNLSADAERIKTLEAELECMKTSVKESRMLIERGNLERNEMESLIALKRMEAEKSLEELTILRSPKHEKELVVGNLQSELENLKAQCYELKNSLLKNDLEKDKLRNQILLLKNDHKEMEDELKNMRKLNESNNKATDSVEKTVTSRNNKSALVPLGSKEVLNLQDKIKSLEGHIKLKETALEASVNSFIEKEKDLQNKIEELEKRVEELNHKNSCFCDHEFQKVAVDTDGVSLNGGRPKEARYKAENLTVIACISNENGSASSLMNSNSNIPSEKELEISTINTRDQLNLEKLLNEIALMKERNKSMEGELKDMQERYSEISLKFAEVEGERQQLIMTVRNLKSIKKS